MEVTLALLDLPSSNSPPLDLPFSHSPLLDCLSSSCCCFSLSEHLPGRLFPLGRCPDCLSPVVLHQKELLFSPNLFSPTSSPCFRACCRSLPESLSSEMSSLCFQMGEGPFFVDGHRKTRTLQEQLDSPAPSCAASKCQSASADLP